MNQLLLYGLGGIGCLGVIGYFYFKGRTHEQFKQLKFNINEVKKVKKRKYLLRDMSFDDIKRKLLKYLRD